MIVFFQTRLGKILVLILIFLKRECTTLSTFFMKENPVFRNGLKILPKNPLDYPILCN